MLQKLLENFAKTLKRCMLQETALNKKQQQQQQKLALLLIVAPN